MAIKRVRFDSEEAKVDFTPIIDIVFNLLIFFMCATRLRADEGLIECWLPMDRGQQAGSAPRLDVQEVRIRVLWQTKDGAPSTADAGFAVVQVGEARLNPPGALEALAVPEESPVWRALHERLATARARYSGGSERGIPVIIDARKEVPTRWVVSVLNEVVRAGIGDVTFAAPDAR